MGIYWKWICEETHAELSPDSFDEGVKHPEEATKTARAVAYLCTFGSWRGKSIRLISDASGEDQERYYLDRTDVFDEAKRLIREFSRV